MDFRPVLLKAVKATAAAYLAGNLSLEEVQARQVRLHRLKRRSHWWQRFKENRRSRVVSDRHALFLVQRVLANGGIITAFDTEFTNEGPMEELGITSWRNGEMLTATYVIPEMEGTRPYFPSLYGPTMPMTRKGMEDIAQVAFDAADLVVFHSAHEDLKRLRLTTTTTRYVDTAKIATLWYKQYPSLTTLCERYGIETDHWHNGGNDSRRTLEALIAMANDERPTRDQF